MFVDLESQADVVLQLWHASSSFAGSWIEPRDLCSCSRPLYNSKGQHSSMLQKGMDRIDLASSRTVQQA